MSILSDLIKNIANKILDCEYNHPMNPYIDQLELEKVTMDLLESENKLITPPNCDCIKEEECIHTYKISPTVLMCIFEKILECKRYGLNFLDVFNPKLYPIIEMNGDNYSFNRSFNDNFYARYKLPIKVNQKYTLVQNIDMNLFEGLIFKDYIPEFIELQIGDIAYRFTIKDNKFLPDGFMIPTSCIGQDIIIRTDSCSPFECYLITGILDLEDIYLYSYFFPKNKAVKIQFEYNSKKYDLIFGNGKIEIEDLNDIVVEI